MADQGRSKTRNGRRADSLFGYLIPMFFVALAGYQEIHDNQIDKYVIGALMVFGLGALGWRIDTLFEKYLEAKGSFPPPQQREQEERANDT